MKFGICLPHYGHPIEIPRMLEVAPHARPAASTHCGSPTTSSWLDLSMPDMTGDQVLQSLVKHGLGARDRHVGTARGAGPGFFAVTGKPLRLREVRQVVAAAVRTGRVT